jgi:hypothetical protein
MYVPFLSLQMRVLIGIAPGRKDLVSLALTSKKLLPSARRHLFAAPLLYGKREWEPAIKLVETLRLNEGALGRLVRDLVLLPAWTETLSSKPTETKLSFQIRGHTKAYSWYLAMLEACPSLKTVGVTFRTTTQLNKVVAFLSPSLPTLTKLRICGIKDVLMPLKGVCELCDSFGGTSLQELEISELETVSNDFSLSSTPSLPISVATLDLELKFDSFAVARALLPISISGLTSLRISSGDMSTSGRVVLIKLVGPTLFELQLYFSIDVYSLRPDAYGEDHLGPTIPLPLFSLLPQLRRLVLNGARALSAKRLAALAEHSPLLAHLEAEESLWVADEGIVVPTGKEGYSRIFPDAQLAVTLNKLKELRYFDAGLVPLDEGSEPSALVDSTIRNGVDFTFQTFGTWCEGCGAWH